MAANRQEAGETLKLRPRPVNYRLKWNVHHLCRVKQWIHIISTEYNDSLFGCLPNGFRRCLTYSGVVKKYFGHYIQGKIQDGRQFSTEHEHIHDFGIYCRVFMYARESSVARKYIRHSIMDDIKYARYLFKVKQ